MSTTPTSSITVFVNGRPNVFPKATGWDVSNVGYLNVAETETLPGGGKEQKTVAVFRVWDYVKWTETKVLSA